MASLVAKVLILADSAREGSLNKQLAKFAALCQRLVDVMANNHRYPPFSIRSNCR